MPDTVLYEQLAQDAPPAPEQIAAPPYGGGREPADLRRLCDVPMEVAVEIGRARMTVGETLQLRPGSIVTLERLAGEPVDLLVNGTSIARGEVVVVDEQFGLRVTEIVEGEPDGVPGEELAIGFDGHPAGTNGLSAGSESHSGAAAGHVVAVNGHSGEPAGHAEGAGGHDSEPEGHLVGTDTEQPSR
jgi:flagellar motor switch protein FliN/FliY